MSYAQSIIMSKYLVKIWQYIEETSDDLTISLALNYLGKK